MQVRFQKENEKGRGETEDDEKGEGRTNKRRELQNGRREEGKKRFRGLNPKGPPPLLTEYLLGGFVSFYSPLLSSIGRIKP